MRDAKYMSIYRQLRDEITGGVYPYGAKLPSKRVLADRYGVSVITIEHAYDLLCDEGYAQAREKSGFYAAFRADDGWLGGGKPGRRTSGMTSEIKNIYERAVSSLNVSDTSMSSAASTDDDAHRIYFPFPTYARTVRKVLSDYGEALFVKSPKRGNDILRSAIADYLVRSRGMRITKDQVIVGSGSEYMYGIIVQMLGSDRIYAVENPSYDKISMSYKAGGAVCEFLDFAEDGIEDSALAASRASVLHITSYRSYPSGITASASKRAGYLRWASRRDAYIVEDDFESEFSLSSKPVDTVFSMDTEERVIYLNTFTRTISPSMRVSYMVLPEHLNAVFDERVGTFSSTVPTIDQYVLAELLNGGEFERHINRVRRRLRTGV